MEFLMGLFHSVLFPNRTTRSKLPGRMYFFLNNRNLELRKAKSFCNHAVQISFREMNYQSIYFQLGKVKIFLGNIYSPKLKLLSNDPYTDLSTVGMFWHKGRFVVAPKILPRTSAGRYWFGQWQRYRFLALKVVTNEK
jgi:hypothetical protein